MFLYGLYVLALGAAYFSGYLNSVWSFLIAAVVGMVVHIMVRLDRLSDKENEDFVQWHHGYKALKDCTQPIQANIESLKVVGGVPWKDMLSKVVLELSYPADSPSHQATAKVQMEDTLMARFMKGDKVWVRIDPKDSQKAYVDLERSPVQVERGGSQAA